MAHHEASQTNCNTDCEEDGCADAFAATAIIAVIVAVATFWLHGMA